MGVKGSPCFRGVGCGVWGVACGVRYVVWGVWGVGCRVEGVRCGGGGGWRRGGDEVLFMILQFGAHKGAGLPSNILREAGALAESASVQTVPQVARRLIRP